MLVSSNFGLTQSLTISEIENLIYQDISSFENNEVLLIYEGACDCIDSNYTSKRKVTFHDNYLVQEYDVLLPGTDDLRISITTVDTTFYNHTDTTINKNVSSGFFCKETNKVISLCVEYDNLFPVIETVTFENGDVLEIRRYVVNSRVNRVQNTYIRLGNKSCVSKHFIYDNVPVLSPRPK